MCNKKGPLPGTYVEVSEIVSMAKEIREKEQGQQIL